MIQHVQSNHEDLLIPGLKYDAEPTASYIESCRLVRFRPSAGDRFSPSARTIRFSLQDHCFLEPGSVRMQFQLNNLDASKFLAPIASPASMFTNFKIYVGGQLCENIEEAGPLCTILDKLKPGARRLNDSMMNHVLLTSDADIRADLAANQSRRVIFELPLGMFKTSKLLPLHLLSGITIEATLGDAMQAFGAQNTQSTPGAASTSWDISDCSLLASCLHVNSTISAQYHEHLTKGLTMPISFASVVGTRSISTTSSFTLSLARSLSALKQLYFVIVKAGTKDVKDFELNVAGVNLDMARDGFSYQVQVGSHRYPDFPVQGAAESFYRLTQAAGLASGDGDIAITPATFVAGSAILAIDFEKVGSAQAAFTGINTQGQVMTLTVNNAWQASDTDVRSIYCYQLYDSVLNIRGFAGGVDIVD